MKQIFLIIYLAVLIIPISSCSDILSTEENYEKELIAANMSAIDSLNLLKFEAIDLGTVKVRTVKNFNVKIANSSDVHSISIYSLENTNKTGLFSYSFPNGMPIVIDPSSNSAMNQDIELKFISDSFVPGMFYDTLIINNNPDFYIPIMVKTKFL